MLQAGSFHFACHAKLNNIYGIIVFYLIKAYKIYYYSNLCNFSSISHFQPRVWSPSVPCDYVCDYKLSFMLIVENTFVTALGKYFQLIFVSKCLSVKTLHLRYAS